ncbi:MAG: HNH endonuclease [Candidatus Lernaella stagnicola]|nr:HNH endonuclease [Candidatus Lernaella stagnicola]
MQEGDIISHTEMCSAESRNLQQGMNFHVSDRPYSVVLMSIRRGSPYEDEVTDAGRVLVYEGHDVKKSDTVPVPKMVDQPLRNQSGSLTQNGRFYEAAKSHSQDNTTPRLVKVYEKIKSGIWVYNGFFALVDAWQETQNGRKVFKFRLEKVKTGPAGSSEYENSSLVSESTVNRMIPSPVKREVWKRDKGRCVKCGSNQNIHFDHIIPFSKGGSSTTAKNIQILCARCNLAKHDKIE